MPAHTTAQLTITMAEISSLSAFGLFASILVMRLLDIS